MRTKRFLSILLTALVVFSVFGMIGASAADWVIPSEGQVSLTVDVNSATDKRVRFTFPSDQKDDFFASYTYKWEVEYFYTEEVDGAFVESTAGLQTISKLNIVETGLYEVEEKSLNRLTLILTPGPDNHYGRYEVKLIITAKDGNVKVAEGTEEIYLVNNTRLANAISEAEAIVANADGKYHDDFINIVKSALTNARFFTSSESEEAIRNAAALLEAAIDIDAQLAADVKVYRLFGWDWFDDLFSQEFKKNYYEGWVSKVFGFFGGIFDWISENINFLSLFTGFIGLITSIFRLLPI
ncbi:MAG: hypothetical protein FWH26_01555 [Oscillospiraceae bacterium]|nr:hypothetical protein [Oscillospiraceae bacterium]